MKPKQKLLFMLLAVALAWQAATMPASAIQVNDVAGEFICNCDCNKLLSACEMKCGDRLRGFIQEQIDKGLGKPQIMQYMKVNFKEAILAAPEKKGFNLMAWVTPFVAVMIGAIVTYKVVGSWVGRRPKDDDDDEDKDDTTGPGSSPQDKQYEDRVENELKEFGW